MVPAWVVDQRSISAWYGHRLLVYSVSRVDVDFFDHLGLLPLVGVR